jgi:hypothetical protein
MFEIKTSKPSRGTMHVAFRGLNKLTRVEVARGYNRVRLGCGWGLWAVRARLGQVRPGRLSGCGLKSRFARFMQPLPCHGTTTFLSLVNNLSCCKP